MFLGDFVGFAKWVYRLKYHLNSRREIYHTMLRRELKNSDFSVISSNCNGCVILSDLNQRFNSPFVNLWISAQDYMKLLKNFDHYMKEDVAFVKVEGIDYPVGRIDDILLYFQHYKSEKEALSKWNERKKRLNMDNCFVLFAERDGCTYQDLVEFDKLPWPNKVVFTHKEYKDIKSSFYIKGFENEECIGVCSNYKTDESLKRFVDDFDFVGWFNGEGIRARKENRVIRRIKELGLLKKVYEKERNSVA